MHRPLHLPTFSSRFLEALPGETGGPNHSRQVHGALWSEVQPTPVAAPRLLAHSPELAAQLGLGSEQIRDPAFVEVLAGNRIPEGVRPFAANYGGHQFGHWAGQLGDGRAISLGEIVAPSGVRYELQLKGAGPTPFSRRGDGRAVLRSSIREFLCSEAMFHLGIPTTRALSLVRTGETVVRDMFYDGNPQPEPGAIVCRVTTSFVRFGSFELCASRGEVDLLRSLADYTLRTHFPELGEPSPETYAAWLYEVARRTGALIAGWQAVGFVHGVMNTDNLSILGETIDYGPYGWLEGFDMGWTPNTTDAGQRRYCYGNQPSIGLWNVERLAIALQPLLEDAKAIEEACKIYEQSYVSEVSRRFANKLGLRALRDADDEALLQECLRWLSAEETDMTLFFRGLADVVRMDEAPERLPSVVREAMYAEPSVERTEQGVTWLRRWWERTRRESDTPEAIASRMNAVNPKFVLRNWLAQEAIDAAHAGDDGKVLELFDVMRRPHDEQPGREAYARKRPEWARNRPGCSALSCSS